jgi:hypothetical protein
MDNLKPVSLLKLKLQARFLLKELQSNSGKSGNEAARFIQIPFFFHKHAGWIREHTDLVQLKHAYQVIAKEYGFDTWSALKQKVIENDCLYKPDHVGFIHSWFTNYPEAEKYLNRHGGYLLTFWKDFVVCGKEYIGGLGLGQYEEQWKRIGYNWAKPSEAQAYQFLKEMAYKNYETR